VKKLGFTRNLGRRHNGIYYQFLLLLLYLLLVLLSLLLTAVPSSTPAVHRTFQFQQIRSSTKVYKQNKSNSAHSTGSSMPLAAAAAAVLW
jgi:hypothetical protein